MLEQSREVAEPAEIITHHRFMRAKVAGFLLLIGGAVASYTALGLELTGGEHASAGSKETVRLIGEISSGAGTALALGAFGVEALLRKPEGSEEDTGEISTLD